MNIDTIQKLNQLNKNFYNTTAVDFDDSRQYFWDGWTELLPFLNNFNQLKLLDLGCGNARFFDFLTKEIQNKKINYLGIDSNVALLNFAKQKNIKEQTDFHLQNEDLVTNLLEKRDFLSNQEFDTIVSFGVFHHIPSFELRLQTLEYLMMKLKDDGTLVLSLWQFLEYKRFQKKILNVPEVEKLKLGTLEKNDFILDWKRGKQALRYCHFIDLEEQKKLIKKANLKLLHSFRADGKQKNINQYIILKKLSS